MATLTDFFRILVRAGSQSTLPLLGGGIDDIIQRIPRASNDAQRLLRYTRAKFLAYADSPSQLQMLALRTRLGEHYRKAWRAGRFPRFHALGRPPVLHFAKQHMEARAP